MTTAIVDVYTTVGTVTLTPPAGCTSADFEGIGGGASGRGTDTVTISAAGGRGGDYAKTINVSMSGVTSVYCQVGAGGATELASQDGQNPGQPTWASLTNNVNAAFMLAAGGVTYVVATQGSTGDVTYSGGTSGLTYWTVGGGGAAGPHGAGGNGAVGGIGASFSAGGTGDGGVTPANSNSPNGFGGGGGGNSNGASNGDPGGLYGGGGGAGVLGSGGAVYSGAGGQGALRVTWYITLPEETYCVPICIGKTYTSQGQILRPIAPQESGTQSPSLGKLRRITHAAPLLLNAQGVSMGVDFRTMRALALKSSGGTIPLTAQQLYSGVYWGEVDANDNYDNMWCWQITRPYPCTLVAVECTLETKEAT